MDSLKEYAEKVVNGQILDREQRTDFLEKFNAEHGTNHREDGTMAQIYHCVKEIVETEELPGPPPGDQDPEVPQDPEQASNPEKASEADVPPPTPEVSPAPVIEAKQEAPAIEKKSVSESANVQESKSE